MIDSSFETTFNLKIKEVVTTNTINLIAWIIIQYCYQINCSVSIKVSYLSISSIAVAFTID